MRIIYFVCVAILTTGGSILLAGQKTIPEMARTQKEPIVIDGITDEVIVSLDGLIHFSDLVVYGVVHPARVYLSDGQTRLQTDYVMDVEHVFFRKASTTSDLATPLNTVAFTRMQGSTTINGVRVLVGFKGAARLDATPSAIVFLRHAADGRYYLTCEGCGAIGVRDGIMTVLPPNHLHTDPAWQRVSGANVDQLTAEIQRIAGKRP